MKGKGSHGARLSPGMFPPRKRRDPEDQTNRKMVRILDQGTVGFQDSLPELRGSIDPALCRNDLESVSILDPVKARMAMMGMHAAPLETSRAQIPGEKPVLFPETPQIKSDTTVFHRVNQRGFAKMNPRPFPEVL